MIYFSDKVVKNTWVLDYESEAHTTPLKNIVKVIPQRMNIMLEMADESTASVADIERNVYVMEKSLALRDLICFAMSNSNFELECVLQLDDDPLMKLPNGDIKTLKYMMAQ
ncbi:hypothetical protein PABG_12280 [Paracoccidioides brasiliensis Pb03]|nr:hypothetical protein PABG_12280 [Paracoccidioides brasiliensis Pb03]